MAVYMPGIYYVVHAFEHIEGKLLYPDSNSESALKDAGWKKLKDGENVVNAKHEVLYRVTIFKEKVPGVQNPAVDRILTDGANDYRPSIADTNSQSSTGRFYTWRNSKEFKKVASLGATFTGPIFYYVRTIHNKFFDWTVVPNGKNGALPKPDFKAQIRLEIEYPSFEDYPVHGTTGQYIEVKQKTGDVTPTIIFSKVSSPQSVPDSVTAFDGRPQNQPYVWDACEKKYIRYWEEPDVKWSQEHPMDTDIKYFVFLRTYDKFGKLEKKEAITTTKVKSEYSSVQNKKGSLMYIAKERMAKIDQASAICGGNANPTVTSEPVVPPKVTVTNVMFNPPPHSVTRHFSPIADQAVL